MRCVLPLLVLLACTADAARLAEALESSNPVVRQDALTEALTTKDAALVEPLIKALADPDPVLRLRAVRALQAQRDQRATAPLAERVSDEVPAVARAAVDALGHLADPAGLPALLPLLELPEPPLNAIWAVGQIADPTALEPLAALRSHESRWVRHQADEALRNLAESG